MERTFAIIKPDGVERNLTGKILERIESQSFKIVAMKRTLLSKAQAEGFYDVRAYIDANLTGFTAVYGDISGFICFTIVDTV